MTNFLPSPFGFRRLRLLRRNYKGQTKRDKQSQISGFSKPRFLVNLCFAPWIPVVFVISVVSVLSANPAINPLVCGCLSCLRRSRDSRHFVKSTGFQNIGLAKPRFRNIRKFAVVSLISADFCRFLLSIFGVAPPQNLDIFGRRLCGVKPQGQRPKSEGNQRHGHLMLAAQVQELQDPDLERSFLNWYEKSPKNPEDPFLRETLCESGRWIDALEERGMVLKKRGRVLKKRGSFLRSSV